MEELIAYLESEAKAIDDLFSRPFVHESIVWKDGRPFLPPLITPEYRVELQQYRREAVIVETRLRAASHQRLVNRVQSVVSEIDELHVRQQQVTSGDSSNNISTSDNNDPVHLSDMATGEVLNPTSTPTTSPPRRPYPYSCKSNDTNTDLNPDLAIGLQNPTASVIQEIKDPLSFEQKVNDLLKKIPLDPMPVTREVQDRRPVPSRFLQTDQSGLSAAQPDAHWKRPSPTVLRHPKEMGENISKVEGQAKSSAVPASLIEHGVVQTLYPMEALHNTQADLFWMNNQQNDSIKRNKAADFHQNELSSCVEKAETSPSVIDDRNEVQSNEFSVVENMIKPMRRSVVDFIKASSQSNLKTDLESEAQVAKESENIHFQSNQQQVAGWSSSSSSGDSSELCGTVVGRDGPLQQMPPADSLRLLNRVAFVEDTPTATPAKHNDNDHDDSHTDDEEPIIPADPRGLKGEVSLGAGANTSVAPKLNEDKPEACTKGVVSPGPFSTPNLSEISADESDRGNEEEEPLNNTNLAVVKKNIAARKLEQNKTNVDKNVTPNEQIADGHSKDLQHAAVSEDTTSGLGTDTDTQTLTSDMFTESTDLAKYVVDSTSSAATTLPYQAAKSESDVSSIKTDSPGSTPRDKVAAAASPTRPRGEPLNVATAACHGLNESFTVDQPSPVLLAAEARWREQQQGRTTPGREGGDDALRTSNSSSSSKRRLDYSANNTRDSSLHQETAAETALPPPPQQQQQMQQMQQMLIQREQQELLQRHQYLEQQQIEQLQQQQQQSVPLAAAEASTDGKHEHLHRYLDSLGHMPVMGMDQHDYTCSGQQQQQQQPSLIHTFPTQALSNIGLWGESGSQVIQTYPKLRPSPHVAFTPNIAAKPRRVNTDTERAQSEVQLQQTAEHFEMLKAELVQKQQQQLELLLAEQQRQQLLFQQQILMACGGSLEAQNDSTSRDQSRSPQRNVATNSSSYHRREALQPDIVSPPRTPPRNRHDAPAGHLSQHLPRRVVRPPPTPQMVKQRQRYLAWLLPKSPYHRHRRTIDHLQTTADHSLLTDMSDEPSRPVSAPSAHKVSFNDAVSVSDVSGLSSAPEDPFPSPRVLRRHSVPSSNPQAPISPVSILKKSPPNNQAGSLNGSLCSYQPRRDYHSDTEEEPESQSVEAQNEEHEHRVWCQISAAAKGWLIRRLLRTERLQTMIGTIWDTWTFANDFRQESPIKRGVYSQQDRQLQDRVSAQITAAMYEFWDIFFEIPMPTRMSYIKQDVELKRERALKAQSFWKPRPRKQPTVKKVSAATQKMLERKKKLAIAEAAVCESSSSLRPKSAPPDRVTSSLSPRRQDDHRVLRSQQSQSLSPGRKTNNLNRPTTADSSSAAKKPVTARKVVSGSTVKAKSVSGKLASASGTVLPTKKKTEAAKTTVASRKIARAPSSTNRARFSDKTGKDKK